MRKLLERSRQRLQEFLEQRRDLVLVVRCSDGDSAMLLKLLREIDEGSGDDLFVQVGGSFADAKSYVEAAIGQLEEEHRLASQAMVETGKPALLPFPAELREPRPSPHERFRAAAMFARQLLPEEARYLVFSVVPDRIANRQAYLGLLAALFTQHQIAPWMKRVRFVFRDEPAPREPRHPLLAVSEQRVTETDLDFGPAAIEGAMGEEVENEALPMEARMQALLSLGMMDAAHARTQMAVERLTHVLGYFQSTKNIILQAVVMNALGDAFLRANLLDQAQNWYECGLLPATEANNPIVLATLVKSLGSVAFAKGRYGDAEQFFDALDKVSGKLLDAETKSWALEWRGLSQAKAGKSEAAVQTWTEGAKLARSTDQPAALRAHLEHLRQFYQEKGLRDRAYVVEDELRRIPPVSQPHV